MIPYRLRRGWRLVTAPPALWLGKQLVSVPLLRYGWNNDSFVADSHYLRLVKRYVLSTYGPILECGSGISTLLIELLCASARRAHVTLEHSEEWADRIRKIAPQATIMQVPLISFGAFDWYAAKLTALPNRVGLVICDGPPGTTRGGRVGALPVLRPILAHPCILLLDDAERPEERAILAQWQRDFSASIEISDSPDGAAAIVRIP